MLVSRVRYLDYREVAGYSSDKVRAVTMWKAGGSTAEDKVFRGEVRGGQTNGRLCSLEIQERSRAGERQPATTLTREVEEWPRGL